MSDEQYVINHFHSDYPASIEVLKHKKIEWRRIFAAIRNFMEAFYRQEMDGNYATGTGLIDFSHVWMAKWENQCLCEEFVKTESISGRCFSSQKNTDMFRHSFGKKNFGIR